VNTTFKIEWIEQPVAELTLVDVADAEAIGLLELKPLTDNLLLLEILQARLSSASYRRSGGPTPEVKGDPIPVDWGFASYEDIAYMLGEYFSHDPWSFDLTGKELPPIDDDEIEGMMMS
jgi:hypothetical protein